MTTVKLGKFIATILILWLLFCSYGILSAQTPYNFSACNCEPVTYSNTRIYKADNCKIVSGGAPFVLTKETEVVTYQVIAKSQFWETSPEGSQCNYLQVFNPYLGIYFTYVHPDMFYYYTEEDVQRRISADGICNWKRATLTFNRFPGAWEAINI